MKDILVPISPGELLDKITILRIKAARMSDPAKVANVKHELGLLEKTWKDSGAAAVNLGTAEADLTRVNEKLWVIEDEIRDEERAKRFTEKFIELARAVYFTNDERAAIKKHVNTLLGSSIVEEKSYQQY
ncbi:MAG TPA: DUF6165 family protein [Steroidobacteraceae bacterium]|jgi:hypothetical protein|nr:DUF6165 family protein [Steroidobacteraceae bacterium]